MNFKNPKIPNVPTKGATTMLKVALFGGAAVYAALNSLYNVDGGHRAIVFNRIQGIKEKVSLSIFLSDLFFSFNVYIYCYGIGLG
jgi:prohibitin 2